MSPTGVGVGGSATIGIPGPQGAPGPQGPTGPQGASGASAGWNGLFYKGKPVITVSAGKISDTFADFGSDSTSNATPGAQGNGTLTVTSGLVEAIAWGKSNFTNGFAISMSDDAIYVFTSATVGIVIPQDTSFIANMSGSINYSD